MLVCVRPGGQGYMRGGLPVKSALFSKLSLVPFLVLAGMSGCGDTGDGANSGQSTQPVCSGMTGQPCQCPNGTMGFQLCMPDGQWSVCSCGNGPPPGAGGFAGNPVPPQGGNPPGGNPICGDGMITGGEQCDGQNHNSQNCGTVSMGACPGGYLICTGSCIFDYTMCVCPGGQGGQGGAGPGGQGGTGPNPPPPPPGGTTGQP